MRRPDAAAQRDLLEAQLDAADLRFLARWCRVLGRRDRWTEAPAARVVFGIYAAAKLAERIREEEGCSRERAEIAAALRLGLNDDSFRRQLRRFRRQMREGDNFASMAGDAPDNLGAADTEESDAEDAA